MCKYCEKENIQYVLNDVIYLYIMNNRHIPPQIVFGNYNGQEEVMIHKPNFTEINVIIFLIYSPKINSKQNTSIIFVITIKD